MKFTISWLKQYLETTATIDEISEKLTDIGLEVESIEDKSRKYQDFEVAKIITAKAHDQSSKLKICQVETAFSKDLIQIICGASNARAGIKVALAKIGAVIPSNSMIIKKSKIAGYESCGMLCSSTELQLGDDDQGIIEIDDKYDIGTKISEIYNLNDVIIDINVTPNRGDCLGVYGIARDLAATNIGKLKDLTNYSNKFNNDFPFKIVNNSNNLCSSISFCFIDNITNCQSPNWLKQRLESVGINSISAIVDIMNYTMMTFNQPMHAYDASKINGDIKIELSLGGEKFTSLKDQEIELVNNSLIICNNNKIISLAGIIGCDNLSCSDQTKQIIIEAAYFDPSNIARSGRKYNLLSDSRYRFERTIDPLSSINAINFAISLITEICGGDASKIISQNDEFNNRVVNFNLDDFKKLINIDIDKQIAIDILTKLGFNINEISANNFELIIPSWRSDITNKEDIIEELIRIYGYDKIKKSPLEITKNTSFDIDSQSIIKNHLIKNNYLEVITWSFVNSDLVNDFTEYSDLMEIANPISQDLNYLRPNLVIGLLNSYKNNSVRGYNDLSLFEMGNVFKDNVSQELVINGIRVGVNKPNSHYQDNREFDIFDVKKDLYDILELHKINGENMIIETKNPLKYYHPYRYGAIKMGNKIIGHFGEIHPLILKKFSIKKRVNLFEISLKNLPQITNKKIKPYKVSSFQSSIRDFAFIIDCNQEVGSMINDIYKIDKKIIKNITLFDIYKGDKLSNNQKSVALSVEMQSLDKTLTSQEIELISNDIIAKITQKYNAIIRNN